MINFLFFDYLILSTVLDKRVTNDNVNIVFDAVYHHSAQLFKPLNQGERSDRS